MATKTTNKKYVRIESKDNIVVYAGLDTINLTNPNVANQDALKVKNAWVNTRVLIKRGTGFYPSCIKDWNSVKSLQDVRFLTIGETTDDCEGDKDAEALYNKLSIAFTHYANDAAKAGQTYSKSIESSASAGTKQTSLIEE